VKLTLTDPFGYVVAANTLAAYGRRADAMRAFDKAIATRPEGYIYVNRALARPDSDKAGRLADYREGVRLDPDNADLRSTLGAFLGRSGDWKAAVEQFDKAILAEPKDTSLRIARGVAHLRLGQAARAEADFAFVRAEAEKDAETLNSMCWEKAAAGLGLDSALVDCDRALALEPDNSAFLDSRAFVLLRLGRLDEALAAYDRALKGNPRAASLYGRALAWARKGEMARARADASAAERLSAGIADTFAGYGLSLSAKYRSPTRTGWPAGRPSVGQTPVDSSPRAEFPLGLARRIDRRALRR
jgi:tetratricopeptide (TPR) repeat protein